MSFILSFPGQKLHALDSVLYKTKQKLACDWKKLTLQVKKKGYILTLD